MASHCVETFSRARCAGCAGCFFVSLNIYTQLEKDRAQLPHCILATQRFASIATDFRIFHKKISEYLKKMAINPPTLQNISYLCTCVSQETRLFVAQSLTRTGTSNEIFMSKTKSVLELRAIAQSPTISDLGQYQARVRVWTEPAYSMLKSKHFL